MKTGAFSARFRVTATFKKVTGKSWTVANFPSDCDWDVHIRIDGIVTANFGCAVGKSPDFFLLNNKISFTILLNFFYCLNWPVSSVAKHTLRVREVWGSISGSVQLDTVLQTARHRRDVYSELPGRGDGPGHSLHASA